MQFQKHKAAKLSRFGEVEIAKVKIVTTSFSSPFSHHSFPLAGCSITTPKLERKQECE